MNLATQVDRRLLCPVSCARKRDEHEEKGLLVFAMSCKFESHARRFGPAEWLNS